MDFARESVSEELVKSSVINIYNEDLTPLINKWHTLDDNYCIFLISSLCRIIYTLKNDKITSKSEAIKWMNEFTAKKYSRSFEHLLSEDIKITSSFKEELLNLLNEIKKLV